MPTQAISAFGIALRLGDGIPAVLNITSATNTSPIVVTTAAVHGIVDVSKVTVTSVAGNTGANGTWIAEAVTPTTARLRGSVGNGAYTSGGVFTLDSTYATIAEVTDIQDAGIMASVINVSAHDGIGGWGSQIPTMLSNNSMRLVLNHVPDHATHDEVTGLLYLMENRIRRPYLLVLPNATKTTWWMSGWVTGWRDQAPVAGALTGQVTFEFDGAPILA
jgi:hypothetical protein